MHKGFERGCFWKKLDENVSGCMARQAACNSVENLVMDEIQKEKVSKGQEQRQEEKRETKGMRWADRERTGERERDKARDQTRGADG